MRRAELPAQAKRGPGSAAKPALGPFPGELPAACERSCWGPPAPPVDTGHRTLSKSVLSMSCVPGTPIGQRQREAGRLGPAPAAVPPLGREADGQPARSTVRTVGAPGRCGETEQGPGRGAPVGGDGGRGQPRWVTRVETPGQVSWARPRACPESLPPPPPPPGAAPRPPRPAGPCRPSASPRGACSHPGTSPAAGGRVSSAGRLAAPLVLRRAVVVAFVPRNVSHFLNVLPTLPVWRGLAGETRYLPVATSG